MTLYEELREEYGAMMTPNEVGVVLKHHPAHIRELCKSGELPSVKIGGTWRILTKNLAMMLEGGDSQ